MEFYKIENGKLIQFQERYIKHEGKIYANPTEEQLRAAGWKKLVTSDKPEAGIDYYYTAVYDDSGDDIIQSWEKVDIVYDEASETESEAVG